MKGEQQLRIAKPEAPDVAPEIHVALVQLAKAHNYADEMTVDPWEFAVEIDRLMASDLATSDLRWLVLAGYVEHAREVTQTCDATRRFQPSRNLAFTKESCFVLTDAGLRLSRKEPTSPSVRLFPDGGAATAVIPRWETDRRVLSIGEQVVKLFPVPSPNQEAILAAFQEEGWPSFIYDPLPQLLDQCPKDRLHDAIKRLNAHQINGLIRFRGDGTGQRVCWALSDDTKVRLAIAKPGLRRSA